MSQFAEIALRFVLTVLTAGVLTAVNAATVKRFAPVVMKYAATAQAAGVITV